MNCSFTPAGDWFVFDEATGAALKAGFRSKAAAITWIATQRAKAS